MASNPLEQYYAKIDDLTGFNPAIVKATSAAAMAAVESRNDPTAWLAYAGEAIKQAWSGLPSDLRRDMHEALNDIIDAALEQADWVVDALGEAAEATSVAPIIGQFIEAAIVIIKMVVETKRGLQASHRSLSRDHKALRMNLTFDDYSDPRDWVFKSMKLKNYTQYVGSRKQGNWSRQPCFRRAGLGTDRMFTNNAGAPDVGKCGHKGGVKMYCDSRREIGYEDCRRYYKDEKKNPPDYCTRYLGISALFYPYWSPAYAVVPIESAFLGEGSDPNAILMARQMMLLTDTYANLRVEGKDLLKMVDRFVTFWRNQLDIFAVDGKKALLRIDDEGNAPGTLREDRYTIDDKEDPNYTGSLSLKNRFYFDSDGRILPYPGMKADVSEWGIRTKGGNGAGTDGGILAVSVGAYNTVITSTMAFFTARSNMLRNGARMKGLLMDHKKSDLDPKVQAAVQYSADEGRMLPAPQKRQATLSKLQMAPSKPGIPTATLVGPLSSPPRFSLESNSIGEGTGEGSSSSNLPLLLGVAAIGIMLFKKK